jgi:glycosyltransferase involved in cell wall biosynthesis
MDHLMKNALDVSVLVTAYNQNSTLEIVLKALQLQDFKGSWEIIVCDDGSEQDTLKAVKRAMLTNGPSMQYVWQSRLGERRARSRNNALRCARGRIVILVDGDIVVKRDFISAHVALHTGGHTAVCGCRYWLFLDDFPEGFSNDLANDPVILDAVDPSSFYSEAEAQEYYSKTPQPWAACWGCNFSFLRDGEMVLFDEEFVGWGAEDQEFACRLHDRFHYDMKFVPSIYGFHLEPGSRSAYTRVRPRSQTEFANYFRNLFYFCSLYPALDMVPACIGVGLLELDPENDVWRPASQPRFGRRHILSTLSTAREWLARFGAGSNGCIADKGMNNSPNELQTTQCF